ncbi:hypothetical protein ACJ41O_009513 [Fusarium nematophilum]
MAENGENKSAKGENPFNDEFAKFANETLDEWKVPGVSIAFIDDNQIFTAGYGHATLPDTPATPKTLWYAASTTKAFTGAVLAQLIDSKKHPALERGWQTPISSILREDFVLQDEWATNHVTLEDAVCHRTGMPRHDKSSSRFLPVETDDNGKDAAGGKKKRFTTVKDVTRNLRYLPLTAEPRVKFQYCNHMYIVLSHCIETVTGKPLAQVMRELIFEPLGMSATYFSLEDAKAAPEHLAAGYFWDKKAGKFVEVLDEMTVHEHSGAGAILSCAEDFAKWARCMLRQEEPFSEAVHKDIRNPRIVDEMPRNGKDVSMYALGWERVLYRGHLMYSHGGGMHAFGSNVHWFPDDKFGVVTFGNTCLTSNAAEDVMLWRLIDEKLGIAPEERMGAGATWKKVIAKFEEDYEKALDIVYPKRPDPPAPSPVSIRDLAGSYYNPGYKTLKFRVEPHPDKEGEEVLLDDREDSTWQVPMELHHVSGNWWIMYLVNPKNNCSFCEYEQVEFKIGPDGKPTAVEVDFYARIGEMYEGKIVFDRVKDE